MGYPSFIQRINAKSKANILDPYLRPRESVLDFGCGDLSLSSELKRRIPSLRIRGVDVVDCDGRPEHIPFTRYDGSMLPFASKKFDTVFAYYVLHHCDDPVASLGECMRVSKKRVILVESVYRQGWERLWMKALDYAYNILKFEHIPMPYNFLSLSEWTQAVKQHKGRILSVVAKKQLFFPSWAPVGLTYIIEIQTKK